MGNRDTVSSFDFWRLDFDPYSLVDIFERSCSLFVPRIRGTSDTLGGHDHCLIYSVRAFVDLWICGSVETPFPFIVYKQNLLITKWECYTELMFVRSTLLIKAIMLKYIWESLFAIFSSRRITMPINILKSPRCTTVRTYFYFIQPEYHILI